MNSANRGRNDRGRRPRIGRSSRIRRLEEADVERVADLAIDAQMFPEEARGFLTGAATAWLAGTTEGVWEVLEEAGTLVGAVFYQPREATDRVWSLQMIVVAPTAQGAGHGSTLLTHVEEALRSAEQRLLLIETSATAAYDRTRTFYAGLGYAEVARVPDYFEDGDDMVLFHKDLRG